MANRKITETDTFIRGALEAADPMVLRVLLRQLGDESMDSIELATTPAVPLGMVSSVANPADAARIRADVFEHIRRLRDEGVEFAAPTEDRESLHHLFEMAVSDSIRDDELDFWIEESGLRPMAREIDWSSVPPADRAAFRVVVIGAGFSGILAAIRMKRAGVAFRVLEKNAEPGGTWYENTYPGVRVDVPSVVYSYSFEPDYPWKSGFAPKAELAEYINFVVDKYDLRDHMEFGVEVTSLTWDSTEQMWSITSTTSDGRTHTDRANAVICANGLFSRPAMPEIEGLESFAGPIMHTAQWDHSIELTGRRVATIGTGSSGMQLVPDLADLVGHLTVFQRTPNWVASHSTYREKLRSEAVWLTQSVPYYANWARVRLAWMFGENVAAPAIEVDPTWDDGGVTISAGNRALRERLMANMAAKIGHRPDLMAKCTPPFPPMAKRVVMDNGWFDALLRSDVDLETTTIRRVTPTGIELVDGREIEVDVIVVATGFRVNDFLHPVQITGREEMTLEELWRKDGGRAYMGMMMPYMPNLWCLYGGPNTNPKSGNPLLQSDLMLRYVSECMLELIRSKASSIEVKEEVYEDFQRLVDDRLATTVWTDARQRSYYHNEFGRVSAQVAWGATEYSKWTRKPDLTEMKLVSAG